MADGFNLELVMDAIAERVAAKLRAEVREFGGVAVHPRLLSVDQAAVYLGRTKPAIQHMISDGQLPVVRSDRRVFLDVRDLDRWIEGNKESIS